MVPLPTIIRQGAHADGGDLDGGDLDGGDLDEAGDSFSYDAGDDETPADGGPVDASVAESCSSDADCPNELWPHTQFCNFQTASGNGECAFGCRSNASCTGGGQCNAQRQCVSP